MGPLDATGVVLTDVLPPGLGVVTAQHVGGLAPTVGPTVSVGNVTASYANFPVSASSQIQIIAQTPQQCTLLTNTASVTSATNDPNLSNNTATETTLVCV